MSVKSEIQRQGTISQISIDIKNGKDEKQEHIPPSLPQKETSNNTCKEIVNNILRTRSRRISRSPYKAETSDKTDTSDKIDIPNRTPDSKYTSIDESESSDHSSWTEEIVQQLILFSDLCSESSKKLKISSVKHKRISEAIHISVIVMGTFSVITSLGNINDGIKLIINTTIGSSITLLTSIQTFLSFPQKSEIESAACLELERMGRTIKIELSKPKETRVDPFKFIIQLENQRDKIIKKVGVNDE